MRDQVGGWELISRWFSICGCKVLEKLGGQATGVWHLERRLMGNALEMDG